MTLMIATPRTRSARTREMRNKQTGTPATKARAIERPVASADTFKPRNNAGITDHAYEVLLM
jgi:hypothetical protein